MLLWIWVYHDLFETLLILFVVVLSRSVFDVYICTWRVALLAVVPVHLYLLCLLRIAYFSCCVHTHTNTHIHTYTHIQSPISAVSQTAKKMARTILRPNSDSRIEFMASCKAGTFSHWIIPESFNVLVFGSYLIGVKCMSLQLWFAFL